MKVYVYTKIAENKNLEGTTTGDIIYIYPIDVQQAKLDIQNFIPIVMDLKIPCEDNFRKRVVDQSNAIQCGRCKWRDEDLCDNIKYTVGEWGEGDLDNPPALLKKRRYKIDRTGFISTESDALVVSFDKTELEKLLSFQRAIDNEQPVSIIEDKTVIDIRSID